MEPVLWEAECKRMDRGRTQGVWILKCCQALQTEITAVGDPPRSLSANVGINIVDKWRSLGWMDDESVNAW
jgi:hypothetical protein